MLTALPPHLRERARNLNSIAPLTSNDPSAFVLYWMRTAVRSDENPALDAAKWIADDKDIPLLVYHSISEHYQYASDRHHTFMLQGARDVQRQLATLGISYGFHLATPDDRRSHLVDLANAAFVVVTEDMPVDPPRRFLNSLLKKTNTPVICVDTACVAPMQLVQKPYTRAFKFKAATKEMFSDRLTRPWPDLDISPKAFDLKQLPFQPLDLQEADLSVLVARCEIDHSVGPVVDTVGGSDFGYQRWNKFRSEHLSTYAKRRNNALLNGVSRMSPYLHYGMVSPFRIAREAAMVNNPGAEKYLDELLIWRELAYAFCFYRDDHDQWSALPNWAQKSLDTHATDIREHLYSWEQLSRGNTNDAFWNVAQKSLLINGELHNNVRMTWGKAILQWKQQPHEALATIIDLNHRYALDGRDPASYGGILWCLGQFDRPFEPEKNILGSVRPRPTSQHASRLDTQKYAGKTLLPRVDPTPNVAVIGAGISGLIAARTLQDHGLTVTVFDKGRGVGGRMSTRRIEGGGTFDHGAQYFTARDHRFAPYVNSWIEQGIVAKWPDKKLGTDQRIVVLENGRTKPTSGSDNRFVAVPTMSAIPKHLAEDIKVLSKTRVDKIRRLNNSIELFDDRDNALGSFDRVIISTPAAQAVELLSSFEAMSAKISKVKMNPCWATMLAFETPITDQWVGAFLHNSFLSWAARNNTKPGRKTQGEHLVIHATPDWTQMHWEEDPEHVAKMMLQEFWKVSKIHPLKASHMQAHRWKYAIPIDPSYVRSVADETSVVVACGDWASGSRVEGAFLSGMAAAGRILGTLTPAANQSATQKSLFN